MQIYPAAIPASIRIRGLVEERGDEDCAADVEEGKRLPMFLVPASRRMSHSELALFRLEKLCTESIFSKDGGLF